MRAVLAMVGGLVAGVAAMMAIAFAGGLIFPNAVAIDDYNAREFAAAFAGLPIGPRLAIVVSWFGGALVGALVAKLIARRRWAPWTIAALFALYVLASVLILPMPAWMQVVAVIAPLIAGLIANRVIADADFGPTGDLSADQE